MEIQLYDNYSAIINEYMSKTISIKAELFFVIFLISIIITIKWFREKSIIYTMTSVIVLFPLLCYTLFNGFIPLLLYKAMSGELGIFLLICFLSMDISLLCINKFNFYNVHRCNPILFLAFNLILYINSIYKNNCIDNIQNKK